MIVFYFVRRMHLFWFACLLGSLTSLHTIEFTSRILWFCMFGSTVNPSLFVAYIIVLSVILIHAHI
jgi:hypothetical protein